MSNSLWPYGLQHARIPCPSLSPPVCSNSCPWSWRCHLTISSSVTPFSSCPQSFPASGSFSLSQMFISSGQSIGASTSASVLPINIQGWFPLGLTGLISLQSKGLSTVFRVYHAKCQAGWIISWNQDCWEKYQQTQICRWYHFNGRKWRGTEEPLDKSEREEWKKLA